MIRYLFFFLFFIPLFLPSKEVFIPDFKKLEPFLENDHVVMITSPGRSGSSLLTRAVAEFAKELITLKAHFLPITDARFMGRVIFIFSNPDKIAESIFHITLNNSIFGEQHFYHVKSSDFNWLKNLGDTTFQTKENNLLCYDALGCYKQLSEWLLKKTISTSLEEATILAVKYENLWEESTITAIKSFLKLEEFNLPPKKNRGYKKEQLSPTEERIRNYYNLGTEEDPIYAAYSPARKIWRDAPSFQFLKIKSPSIEFHQ